MKKFALTTIVALTVAAPALAQSQLERSVGAAAGQYSVSELARLANAQNDSGNEAVQYFGNETIRFSSRNLHNDTAKSIFDRLADENGSGATN